MRWVLVAALWASVIAGVLVVVSNDWGPVAISVSERNTIRVSDLVAFVLGVAVAAGATWLAWATAPDRRAASVAWRWLVCSMVWIAAVVGSLYVASQTRIGPVVLTITAHHGVHLDDLLYLAVGVVVATAVTVVARATLPPAEHPDHERRQPATGHRD